MTEGHGMLTMDKLFRLKIMGRQSPSGAWFRPPKFGETTDHE